MAEFKKISDVDVVNALTDSDNVLVIGSDGALKQTASSNIKGSASWNDLTDRPFYEETETIEPITWDGNTEGLVEVDIIDGKFYKVSDKAFSNEQIKEMSASIYSEWVDPEGSGSGVFPVDIGEQWESMVQSSMVTEDFVFLIPFGAVVIHKNNVSLPNGIALPEIGTYFQRREQNDEGSYYLEYMTSFPSEAMTETTIKKIDEKYLPESNVFTVVVTNHSDEELTIDKSFEDAMLAAKSGKYIDAKYVFAHSSGSFAYGQFYEVSFTPDNYDVPCFEVINSSNNTFYWTSDGISTEAPSGGR